MNNAGSGHAKVSIYDRWQDAPPLSKAAVIGLGLSLLVTMIVRLLQLELQTDWDEELYFLIARGWAHGLLPYRDIFDHKPPGVYLAYLLGTGFGTSFAPLRLAVAAALLFSAHAFVRAISPRGTPIWRATLTLALVTLFTYREGGGSNTELLYSPALMLTAAMLLSGRAISAGLFAALALSIKYTCAMDLLGILIFYAGLQGGQPNFKKTALTWIAFSTLLFFLVYGTFFAYFHHHGVDLFHDIITRNLQHGSGERQVLITKNGLYHFLKVAVPLMLLAAVFSAKGKYRNKASLAALSWLGLSIAQGLLTGQYYYHYFVPAFIPVVALIATLRPHAHFNSVAVLCLIGGAALILCDALRTRETHQHQLGLIQPFCRSINHGAYILDTFLAGYRECGLQRVDKYVFPAFYLSPHFARVSESGGMAALSQKLDTGQIPGLLIREGGAFSEKHRAQDIPNNLDVK
jgi:hypothetical protein